MSVGKIGSTHTERPRDTALFTAILIALWILCWLLHLMLAGKDGNLLLGENILIDTAYWALLKCVVWVLFPLLWVWRITSSPVAYLGLSRSKVARCVVFGLAGGLVWAAFSIAAAYAAGQKLNVLDYSILVTLYAVIFTPFVEELVFRGFVLTSLVNSGQVFWKANLFSSALFLSPHLVGWAFQGVLLKQVFSAGAVSVMLLSLFAGFVKHRSGSLWGGFLVHAVNNLLSRALK